MSIVGRNDSKGELRLFTSNSNSKINANQQYTVVLEDVRNPATPQTPVNHLIKTGEGCSIIDSGTVAANEIVSGVTNPPAVHVQIPDKSNLEESEGVIQYIENLNDHFIDLDEDNMTFSAVSSDPSAVSVSLSGLRNKRLWLEAKKYGSADITVTATAVDGFVDDVFNVTAIGLLTVNSISATSNIAGEVTDFTFNFTLESPVSPSGGDGAYLFFDFPNAFVVDSGSRIKSISPAIPGGCTSSRSVGNSSVFCYANTTISAGTYTVTLGELTNPPSAGSYGDVVVDTRNGGGTTYDKGAIATPAITASNEPTVTSPIPDQSDVEERDGVQVLIDDLNNNFNDSDGDPLTFSAISSDPLTVAVTTSGTNGRMLSIEAKKFGSATITVTATAIDGSVDDEFDVDAIGELIIHSINSSSLAAGQMTNLTVNFTLETTVSDANGDGAYLYFDLPTQYGVGDSTVITVTSPPLAGTTYRNAGSSNVWFIANASTIPAGTYTATIGNVTNPSSDGSYGYLELDTRDGGGTTFDIGELALSSVTGDYPWILFFPAFMQPQP